jgi:hypothetical protein
MRVFISWSGDRSKALAEIIRQWLPSVIQAIKPYFSPDDIAKGTRWSSEIAGELAQSRVGLICLTSDNLDAPWLMFEAGALSKGLDKANVIPILFNVDPTDVKGPLTQFQAARFDKRDIKKVISTINAQLADNALATEVIDSVFEVWWPKLEERVRAELGRSDDRAEESIRSDRELLMELLELTRTFSRRARTGVSPRAVDDVISGYSGIVNALFESAPQVKLIESLEAVQPALEYLISKTDSGSKLKYREAAERLESIVSWESDDESKTASPVEPPFS